MRVLRQWLVLLTISLISILSVIPSFAQDTGSVRFVHAVEGSAPVDVYLNGTLSISNLAFGRVTNRLSLPVGTVQVTVTEHADTTPLWEQEIGINAGAAQLFVATTGDTIAFIPFTQDVSPLLLGSSRFTALNAITNVESADVLLADGRVVISELASLSPYGTLDIPSGVYQFGVAETGGTLESPLVTPVSTTLNSGSSYILVAYGSETNADALVVSEAVTTTEAGGWVRFVQAIDGAPSVDVSVDGTLVSAGLAYGQPASDFIPVAEGEHEIGLHLAGEAEAFITATLDVAADSTQTVVVHGTPTEVEVSSFTADTDLATETTAVVSIINVSAEDISASVGEAVSIDVASGESVSTPVEKTEDLLTVGIATDSDIYGGVLYEAVAVDGTVLFLAPVSFAQGINSAPSAATDEVVVEATEEAVATEAPVVVEAQPTVAPVTSTDSRPTATLRVNPGVNVQLRNLPSINGTSLGLAPSDAVLFINGRNGEPVFDTNLVTPDPEATPYVDPVTLLGEGQDLDPNETWVYVTYVAPDGTALEAWVNSLYTNITDATGALVPLRELAPIPSNRRGGVVTGDASLAGSIGAPAPTRDPNRDVAIATVYLDAGASLQFRRYPSTVAESLGLIGANQQLTVTGRTEAGDWLQAEYQGQVGWISARYVGVTFNGSTYDPAQLPVISDVFVPGSGSGSTNTTGATAVPQGQTNQTSTGGQTFTGSDGSCAGQDPAVCDPGAESLP